MKRIIAISAAVLCLLVYIPVSAADYKGSEELLSVANGIISWKRLDNGAEALRNSWRTLLCDSKRGFGRMPCGLVVAMAGIRSGRRSSPRAVRESGRACLRRR